MSAINPLSITNNNNSYQTLTIDEWFSQLEAEFKKESISLTHTSILHSGDIISKQNLTEKKYQTRLQRLLDSVLLQDFGNTSMMPEDHLRLWARLILCLNSENLTNKPKYLLPLLQNAKREFYNSINVRLTQLGTISDLSQLDDLDIPHLEHYFKSDPKLNIMYWMDGLMKLDKLNMISPITLKYHNYGIELAFKFFLVKALIKASLYEPAIDLVANNHHIEYPNCYFKKIDEEAVLGFIEYLNSDKIKSADLAEEALAYVKQAITNGTGKPNSMSLSNSSEKTTAVANKTLEAASVSIKKKKNVDVTASSSQPTQKSSQNATQKLYSLLVEIQKNFSNNYVFPQINKTNINNMDVLPRDDLASPSLIQYLKNNENPKESEWISALDAVRKVMYSRIGIAQYDEFNKKAGHVFNFSLFLSFIKEELYPAANMLAANTPFPLYPLYFKKTDLQPLFKFIMYCLDGRKSLENQKIMTASPLHIDLELSKRALGYIDKLLQNATTKDALNPIIFKQGMFNALKQLLEAQYQLHVVTPQNFNKYAFILQIIFNFMHNLPKETENLFGSMQILPIYEKLIPTFLEILPPPTQHELGYLKRLNNPKEVSTILKIAAPHELLNGQYSFASDFGLRCRRFISSIGNEEHRTIFFKYAFESVFKLMDSKKILSLIMANSKYFLKYKLESENPQSPVAIEIKRAVGHEIITFMTSLNNNDLISKLFELTRFIAPDILQRVPVEKPTLQPVELPTSSNAPQIKEKQKIKKTKEKKPIEIEVSKEKQKKPLSAKTTDKLLEKLIKEKESEIGAILDELKQRREKEEPSKKDIFTKNMVKALCKRGSISYASELLEKIEDQKIIKKYGGRLILQAIEYKNRAIALRVLKLIDDQEFHNKLKAKIDKELPSLERRHSAQLLTSSAAKPALQRTVSAYLPSFDQGIPSLPTFSRKSSRLKLVSFPEASSSNQSTPLLSKKPSKRQLNSPEENALLASYASSERDELKREYARKVLNEKGEPKSYKPNDIKEWLTQKCGIVWLRNGDGSHEIWGIEGVEIKVTVPQSKDQYPDGTAMSIFGDAGIIVEIAKIRHSFSDK